MFYFFLIALLSFTSAMHAMLARRAPCRPAIFSRQHQVAKPIRHSAAHRSYTKMSAAQHKKIEAELHALTHPEKLEQTLNHFEKDFQDLEQMLAINRAIIQKYKSDYTQARAFSKARTAAIKGWQKAYRNSELISTLIEKEKIKINNTL